MASFFSKLFKLQDNADYASLIQNGAIILDVRTVEEYTQGHVKGSINIPLDILDRNFTKLPKDNVIIAVCESGIRSRSAVSFLKNNGYAESYNAGSWYSLK